MCSWCLIHDVNSDEYANGSLKERDLEMAKMEEGDNKAVVLARQ